MAFEFFPEESARIEREAMEHPVRPEDLESPTFSGFGTVLSFLSLALIVLIIWTVIRARRNAQGRHHPLARVQYDVIPFSVSSPMKRYLAGFIGAAIAVALGLSFSLGIAEALYSSANPPGSFFRITTAFLAAFVYGTAVMAYREPDWFISSLRGIARILSIRRLATPTQRLLFLLFVIGVFGAAGTIALYYANDHAYFLKERFFANPLCTQTTESHSTDFLRRVSSGFLVRLFIGTRSHRWSLGLRMVELYPLSVTELNR